MGIHPYNGKRAGDFWRRREPATVPPENPLSAPEPEYRLNEEPKDSQKREPMALLEAALFLAKVPYSSRKLAQLAGLPEGTKNRQLLRELNERYDKDQSAFCVAEVAEGFQLRTRPEFAAWLVRMQGIPAAVRLSNPAMETLTVIAYRQPIPRAEVERVRGVQCGDLIRQLVEQDLAKIVGRSEELGRPFLYGTTPKFLQVFGLGNLNDLPVL
jgi:segregation and condensation protein B